MDNPSGKTPAPPPADATATKGTKERPKEDRLARALRDNLLRRKAANTAANDA